MIKRILTVLALTIFLLQGCNLVYKQNIQQGNAIEQEDLDKLRVGMTKNQVSFLLGTPSIHDPFHHDRWDYVSSFSRRGEDAVMRKVTLFFENGALSEMIGVENDSYVSKEEEAEQETDEAATEVEPDSETTDGATPAEVNALNSPAAEQAPYEAPADGVANEPMAAESTLPDQPAAEVVPAQDLAAEPVIESIEEPLVPPQAPQEIAEELAEAMEDWTIQLGAFDERENAETVLNRLQEAGFDAEILKQNTAASGERYLVRKTGIESADAARQLLDDIAAGLGISGFVVPRDE